MIDPAPIHDQIQYREGESPNQSKMLMLPSWVTWLTKLVKAFKAVAGESVLASSFTLDQANDTYQDIGVSISLPAAGQYKIFGHAQGHVNFLLGSGYITLQLYNATDSAYVTSSYRLVVYGAAISTDYYANGPIGQLVDVNGPKTIKIYAARHLATTWVTSEITSANLGYERIGD